MGPSRARFSAGAKKTGQTCPVFLLSEALSKLGKF